MEQDRYERYGAATGIIAVILIIVGFGVGASGLPDIDAAADEWSAFVADNQSQIQLGMAIGAIGIFFLIWFLGSLRSALRVAEGGTGRLSSIAFGGGLVGAAALTLTLTAFEAAAFRTDASPDTVRGLFDLSTVSAAPGMAGVTALFAATAIVGYRHRPFAAPVAGFAALAAIAQPLALGAGLTDSGVFSGEGVLGLWVPIATFAVATIALSAALTRQAGAPPSAP
ncbi:MAG: hypothetical protein ACHQJ5_01190 [Vicinamibacteria bacterium]|jgi:hypothetical protein